MEDYILQLLNTMVAKFPIGTSILIVLGSLMVLAQIIVPMTPTKKDDEILDKIEKNSFGKKFIEFIVKFAPFQKK